MSQVVQMQKKRSRKIVQPPLPPLPDLDRVKQMSMARMSVQHICLLLGISEDDYRALERDSKEFRDALERGRAEAIFACAQVLLKAAQGQLFTKVTTRYPATKDKPERIEESLKFTDKEAQQVEASKEYLKRHAPEWLED